MIDRMNRVAHYEAGTSDKVYMACVREAVDGGFEVLGKWGRRGKKLSSQVKGKYGSLQEALRAQGEVFSNKLGEGYIDIESSSYRGSLTASDPEIRANLEKTSVVKAPVVPAAKKIPLESERMLDPKTMVAVCVDNSGMEDRFDVGTSYVFETVHLVKGKKDTAAQPAKKGMVWVFDKLGDEDEYMLERFRFVKEE